MIWWTFFTCSHGKICNIGLDTEMKSLKLFFSSYIFSAINKGEVIFHLPRYNFYCHVTDISENMINSCGPTCWALTTGLFSPVLCLYTPLTLMVLFLMCITVTGIDSCALVCTLVYHPGVWRGCCSHLPIGKENSETQGRTSEMGMWTTYLLLLSIAYWAEFFILPTTHSWQWKPAVTWLPGLPTAWNKKTTFNATWYLVQERIKATSIGVLEWASEMIPCLCILMFLINSYRAKKSCRSKSMIGFETSSTSPPKDGFIHLEFLNISHSFFFFLKSISTKSWIALFSSCVFIINVNTFQFSTSGKVGRTRASDFYIWKLWIQPLFYWNTGTSKTVHIYWRRRRNIHRRLKTSGRSPWFAFISTILFKQLY